MDPFYIKSGMLWYEPDFMMGPTFNINGANFERVTKNHLFVEPITLGYDE